jgi:predicted PurR-regulated permease PerM
MQTTALQPEHPLSYRALFRVVITSLLILLAWLAFDAVIAVFVACVFTAAIHPIVEKLHKKLSSTMLFATLLFFMAFTIPIIGVGYYVYPMITTEFPQLFSKIDDIVLAIPIAHQLLPHFSVTSYIASHTSNLISTGGSIIYGVTVIVSTIMLTFYFVYDYKRLLELVMSIFPKEEHDNIASLVATLKTVVGQYIRGNLAISAITFATMLASLSLLRIPYAFFLALFAAVFDLLPLVGAAIGAVPSLLIAFSISNGVGVAVLVIHALYQQIENAIISPYIYNKALNVYPALGFLAVLVGGTLFGVLGAFLALPIAASFPVLIAYRASYKYNHSHRVFEDISEVK